LVLLYVFNFKFDLLWTGRGLSGSSAAFLGFRELQQIETNGYRLQLNTNTRDEPYTTKTTNRCFILKYLQFVLRPTQKTRITCVGRR